MDTFTTSRGVTVEILAIQTLLEKFEASERLPRIPPEFAAILGEQMPKPDAPTYDVKVLGGRIEKYFHDETTIETETERVVWSKYQVELAAYQADRANKQKRLVFLYGLKVPMPPDDAWVKAQEELGIVVPSDPTERKLHYIETEVCGGVKDFMEILKRCTLAALPQEYLAQAEALFQRSLGGYTAARTTDTPGQMDGELPIPAGGSGVEGQFATAESL